jgi:uncharacterized protein YdhG (YjbR/CyaY superfamily)
MSNFHFSILLGPMLCHGFKDFRDCGTRLKVSPRIGNMKTNQQAPQTIDEYIDEFRPDVQVILESLRTTIRRAAPNAEEAIKYRLPTFVLGGNLVHFGAFKKHIGFYATPTGNKKFRKELAAYEGAKGSVQFPLDKPIPFGLVSKMVKFRVKENLERLAAKKKKK